MECHGLLGKRRGVPLTECPERMGVMLLVPDRNSTRQE